MKDQLKNIEKYLQDFFENRLQNLAGKDLFTEITKSVIEELHAGAISNTDKVIAPNIYRVSLNLARLPESNDIDMFSDSLKTIIKTECQENGFSLPGPIHIQFFRDQKLTDRYLINSSISTPPSRDTARILAMDSPNDEPHEKMQGYLITAADDVFELNATITNIGRQEDNELVVDNLLVSRLHAQIRVLKGRHILFDLDSSAGTKVNGQRIRQIALNPGDVIEIADVSLIYYRELDDKHRLTPEKITRKIP
jgi:hypothetical protein